MAHGDFPHEHEGHAPWEDYPIYGVTEKNEEHIHWQQVKKGKGYLWEAGTCTRPEMTLTAGTYVCVVTGSGATVRSAAEAAYDLAWELKWPSNIAFRTDIGKRLEEQLPELDALGYAKGMRYG
jgi:phosphoribosylamine-glycine ligase